MSMFECPSCGEVFDYESFMLRHVRENHPQRYQSMMVDRELERERGERDDDYP